MNPAVLKASRAPWREGQQHQLQVAGQVEALERLLFVEDALRRHEALPEAGAPREDPESHRS